MPSVDSEMPLADPTAERNSCAERLSGGERERAFDPETEKVYKHLERKLNWLQTRQSKVMNIYLGLLAFGIICLLFSIGLFVEAAYGRDSSYRVASIICFVLGGALVSVVPIFKTRLRYIENCVVDTEFEQDILRFESSMEAKRADKLLRMNQHQLRRYYEQNLQQGSWVFALGSFCILIGIAIIGTAMHFVDKSGQTDEKIIIAVLGGIGGILTNFIAAVFLQMHAASTKNLNEFHSKLVATQQLFLANLIASLIESDTTRWETLAKISQTMIDRNH